MTKSTTGFSKARRRGNHNRGFSMIELIVAVIDHFDRVGDSHHLAEAELAAGARRRGHAPSGRHIPAGARICDRQSPLRPDFISREQSDPSDADEHADARRGWDQPGAHDPDTGAAAGFQLSTECRTRRTRTATAAPIVFEGIVNGPVGGMVFQSDGEFLDGATFLPINGSVFMGMPGQQSTARAVTILGTTGRVRGWKSNGNVTWYQF